MSRVIDATLTGRAPMGRGNQAFGESGRVAATYRTYLVERENMANNRNQGASGPKALVGTVPMVTMASRKTGRIA